jgi:hypothetical protein
VLFLQVELGMQRMNELMKLCNKFMLRRTSTVLKELLPTKVEQVSLLPADPAGPTVLHCCCARRIYISSWGTASSAQCPGNSDINSLHDCCMPCRWCSAS